LLHSFQCYSIYDQDFSVSLQSGKPWAQGAAISSVLELSEEDVYLSGAKAAACGRLAALSLVSKKGRSVLRIVTFVFFFSILHVLKPV